MRRKWRIVAGRRVSGILLDASLYRWRIDGFALRLQVQDEEGDPGIEPQAYFACISGAEKGTIGLSVEWERKILWCASLAYCVH
jgi:hypothetical protein